MLCLDDCFATTTMPQLTEITQFIFAQPLRTVNPTYGKPIYCPGPLEEIVGVYDSTRPLRTTFDGSDPGEHDLLMQYAEGK
jgi:hypothetical protein